MPPATRKRGQAAGGDGDDDRSAALLGALGLGSFARLDLPAPIVGLDPAAAVDLATGCIIVSLGGACVTASPADLAAALALPLGPVSLAPEVDAAVFSSAEAIATVRGFVHDRLLLGAGGDGVALPEEALLALRLVEEGMAYMVDWARLVWAVLKREVLTGKARRCTQHLLRLMECQRPELFSEVDEMLLLGKRRKGMISQHCQRTDVQLVDCSDAGVEKENLLHENRGNDQRLGAEVEGLVSRVSQNMGESLIFGDIGDDQNRAAEAKVRERLVSGVTQDIGESSINEDISDDQYRTGEAEMEEGLPFGVSQNTGESLIRGGSSYYQCRVAEVELEEMPILGNVKEIPGVDSVDYNKAIVDEGEEGHGMRKGNAKLESQKCLTSYVKVLGNEGKGDGGVAANYQSSDDSSLFSLLRTMYDQDHLPSPHKMNFGTKSQSRPDQQHIIEIEDEENDNACNVDVGPSPPVIRLHPLDHIPDRKFLSFGACLQKIIASVPNMETAVLKVEQTIADTQAELQHTRGEVEKKNQKIESTSNDIMEELQARHIKIYQLEQDKEAMLCTFQQCKQLFQKSSAAFLEYKNKMFGDGDESSSDVVSMADGKNPMCLMQQQRAHQTISKFQKKWFTMFSACIEQIARMEAKMTDLNNEVQKLKNSRSIPDLNKGEPQL